MKAITLATLCAATTTLLASQQVQAAEAYPFVLYSGAGNGQPQEVKEPVKFTAVMSKYKQFVGDATNVVVIVKEGLTSQLLASNAKNFNYLGSKLAQNSFTYSDVEGGFDISAYEGNVHAHQKYSLEQLADLDTLANKIVSDLQSTNALFKISLLTVSDNVPVEGLDQIIQKIEKLAESVDQKAAFVIAGAPSQNQQAAIHTINLAETTEEPISVTQAGPVLSGPGKYLFPNALIGLLFAAFMLFFLISGYLTLMSVQTPYFFPTENIDFGKIEK